MMECGVATYVHAVEGGIYDHDGLERKKFMFYHST